MKKTRRQGVQILSPQVVVVVVVAQALLLAAQLQAASLLLPHPALLVPGSMDFFLLLEMRS